MQTEECGPNYVCLVKNKLNKEIVFLCNGVCLFGNCTVLSLDCTEMDFTLHRCHPLSNK